MRIYELKNIIKLEKDQISAFEQMTKKESFNLDEMIKYVENRISVNDNKIRSLIKNPNLSNGNISDLRFENIFNKRILKDLRDSSINSFLDNFDTDGFKNRGESSKTEINESLRNVYSPTKFEDSKDQILGFKVVDGTKTFSPEMNYPNTKDGVNP